MSKFASNYNFVYGTNNPAKLESMRTCLASFGVGLISLKETGVTVPDVDENGGTPLENARIKASAYYKVLQRPVFACDSGLYIDGLTDSEQPGVHVRMVNGTRLTDDEMVEHYTAIAAKLGGKAVARYRNAICLIMSENEVYEHFGDDISGEAFCITDKPHPRRIEGFPLDCISVHIESGEYYYWHDRDNNTGMVFKGFQEFFRKVLSTGNKPQMTHKGTVTLETERLILRRFESTDAEPMFRNWANDPEVSKFLTWPTHTSVDVSKSVISSWIELYTSDNHYSWAIVLKELGEPIGSIAAVKQDPKTNMVEIGYCIGKTWWGKGYMTEALTRLVQFFFEEIGVNRIEACYDKRNPNSGKVMQKAGLLHEGTLRSAGRNNQGICDDVHYAILAADYFGQRKEEISAVPHNCKYRLAAPSDTPELLKLNDLFNGEGCNNLAAIEESLRNNTQEIVCVAIDGETLIGFCCGQIFKSMCYDVNYGEITELFVIESHRRQRVASGLMLFIESEFRNQGINHFQLFTGGENKIGQAFYRKQGYKATTEIMFRKCPLNGETKND